jgi:hypothetical protein
LGNNLKVAGANPQAANLSEDASKSLEAKWFEPERKVSYFQVFMSKLPFQKSLRRITL